MAVTVHVTSVIQQAVNGQREFAADGATVRELIENIEASYPGFARNVVDEDGELRRFVNIYLNDEDVRYLGGKETALKDGDTVSFLPALAGGV
ncbi:MAG: MoaD family protein [Dehalococcoidia bacterium]